MIQTILIPVDGSDHSKTAIDYGIYIAEKLGAELIGLHVIDIRLMQGPIVGDVTGTISPPLYQDAVATVEASLEGRADSILKDFRERCSNKGLCREVKKVVGVIDDAIMEEGKNADWILLAQRGKHFHIDDGAILGSTAESVVRHSGKPVLVTPENFMEIESIALAYDGSQPADHALELVIALSEKALWPLTVITISSDSREADSIIRKLERRLESLTIEAETLIFTGKEDKILLNFIREGSVEMIVMGAFGHNRLHEFFLGSTTSSVIRKSQIPVLLTR
ncbi:MAG: universal stress protein [Syntrophales bacterium]|jgi:nucleotide-binding universal stress UspA family protein